MSCPVCAAPAIPVDDVCVFCRSPIAADEAPDALLDYLAERLPSARVGRGILHRETVSEFSMPVGSRTFRAAWKKSDLVLDPDVELNAWLDLLLAALSDAAANDSVLRRQLLRAGWALR